MNSEFITWVILWRELKQRFRNGLNDMVMAIGKLVIQFQLFADSSTLLEDLTYETISVIWE